MSQKLKRVLNGSSPMALLQQSFSNKQDCWLDFVKFKLGHFLEDTFGFPMIYRFPELAIISLRYEPKTEAGTE